MYNQIIKKSYGIACCRLNTRSNQLEILLIHKRTTFSFVEFAFGRYREDDETRLLYLFNNMTHEEKLDIRSLDFGRVWYRIWLVNPESLYTPDSLKLTPERHERYIRCRNKFQSTFLTDHGEYLMKLLSNTVNKETLWEIPKGRMNFAQEKPLNCAIREFYEETGIGSSEYEIISDVPYTNYVQNGKIRYENYYYLAILGTRSPFHSPYKLRIDFSRAQQISEVIGMQWVDLKKLLLIDTGEKLYQIVRLMFKILRKKYKIKRLSTS